jgi:hypothetical protein
MIAMMTNEPAPISKFEYAERELGSFLRAVVRSFGRELEQTAADQWMATLTSTPCNGAEPEAFFRRISVLTAAQLAMRISARTSFCSQLEYSEPCAC